MTLSLARMVFDTTVLGPGHRAVVWAQGCTLGCPGCIAPHTHDAEGGQRWQPGQLAGHLDRECSEEIGGLTISGGEPFQQAAAVADLIDEVRKRRAWNFMVYTGYTLEWLQAKGSASQRRLLESADLLMDGRYRQAEATNLRWRGSENQRLHLLSVRPDLESVAVEAEERGVWVEAHLDADGALDLIGIPPPGLIASIREEAKERGIAFSG